MRKSILSFESLEDIPIDETELSIHNPDEIMENDFMEMHDQSRNIDAIQDSIEEAIVVTGVLESMSVKLENSELTPKSARVLNTAIEHLLSNIGYDKKEFPAMESFGGTMTRVEGTKIALEFIKQTVVAIWDAIVSAIKTVIGWIVKFIKWFFGINSNTQAKLDGIQIAISRYKATSAKNDTWFSDFEERRKKRQAAFDKAMDDIAKERDARFDELKAKAEQMRKDSEERTRKAKEKYDEAMRRYNEKKASEDILKEGIRPGQDALYKGGASGRINESGVLIAKGASFSNFFGNSAKDSSDYIHNFTQIFPRLVSDVFIEVEDSTGAINIASKKWLDEIKNDGKIEINSEKYTEQGNLAKVISKYLDHFGKVSTLTNETRKIFHEKFLQQNPNKNINDAHVTVMPFGRTIFYVLNTSDSYFPGLKTGIITYAENQVFNDFLPALNLEDAEKVKKTCENILKINTHNKKIAECEDTLNKILETFKGMPSITQKSAKCANAIKNVINAAMVSMCNFLVYKEKTVNHGLDYCNASIKARITYLEQAMADGEKEVNEAYSKFDKDSELLLAA